MLLKTGSIRWFRPAPWRYATSLSLLALAAVVIWDCTRIGFGWMEGQGPASGVFPSSSRA